MSRSLRGSCCGEDKYSDIMDNGYEGYLQGGEPTGVPGRLAVVEINTVK